MYLARAAASDQQIPHGINDRLRTSPCTANLSRPLAHYLHILQIQNEKDDEEIESGTKPVEITGNRKDVVKDCIE